MIQSLRVRNLALLEELELEFGKGLHVVTGETGAGKSILLGAIGLLCGRRVSSEIVRSGEREARVEALFDAGELLARARELGLAEEDESELLVARSVSQKVATSSRNSFGSRNMPGSIASMKWPMSCVPGFLVCRGSVIMVAPESAEDRMFTIDDRP